MANTYVADDKSIRARSRISRVPNLAHTDRRSSLKGISLVEDVEVQDGEILDGLD